jgi:methionine-rich copper-binding protein CopC
MTDEKIIAYLLKELPEEELEQFEDECFAQESWPTEVNLVEDDLIDTYLREELTQERRGRFERNYLTTEARQERVLIAAALLRHVDKNNRADQVAVAPRSQGLTWAGRFSAFWRSQSWVFQTSSALGLVAIITGALWLSLSHAPSPRTYATLTLSISISNNRAEGIQVGKVKLPLSASDLRISLKLPERLPPAARYRVELEDENGVVKPLEMAGQDAQSVSVVIPAAQLTRGQYALKLFALKADGSEERINGSYFFAVE